MLSMIRILTVYVGCWIGSAAGLASVLEGHYPVGGPLCRHFCFDSAADMAFGCQTSTLHSELAFVAGRASQVRSSPWSAPVMASCSAAGGMPDSDPALLLVFRNLKTMALPQETPARR